MYAPRLNTELITVRKRPILDHTLSLMAPYNSAHKLIVITQTCYLGLLHHAAKHMETRSVECKYNGAYIVGTA